VEFYDLTQSKTFLRTVINGELPTWVEQYTRFIHRAVGGRG
jgi:hypothetical protein